MDNNSINEKAPGDAGTSDTGAVEKIQVQDSTDQEKNQGGRYEQNSLEKIE